MHEAFEMRVEDVFVFQTGRTVFLGKLNRETGSLPILCEVIVDGRVRGRVLIDAVELPLTRKKIDVSSISTSTPIDVSDAREGAKPCVVREVLE